MEFAGTILLFLLNAAGRFVDKKFVQSFDDVEPVIETTYVLRSVFIEKRFDCLFHTTSCRDSLILKSKSVVWDKFSKSNNKICRFAFVAFSVVRLSITAYRLSCDIKIFSTLFFIANLDRV